MTIELDRANAFDMVRHRFLIDVLKKNYLVKNLLIGFPLTSVPLG
jgi:hypothetical protein